MKCQRCPKPATFHITDIERGKPKEFHFCDEHARQHLSPSSDGGDKPEISSLAEKLSQLRRRSSPLREPETHRPGATRRRPRGWGQMAKDGESMATVSAVIAPRSSPVRVRLAPQQKGLHKRALRFPGRRPPSKGSPLAQIGYLVRAGRVMHRRGGEGLLGSSDARAGRRGAADPSHKIGRRDA